MNIVIIGAGASAVLCAIEASKNTNNHITIIESNTKPLKKLLITGNGKCNFTNTNFPDKSYIKKIDMTNYYNNDFYYNSFINFSNIDLIDYFYKLGMPISILEKYNQKYVYPITKNSRTLYYLLLDNLNKNNIRINLDEVVLSFKQDNNKFIITTNKNIINSDVLVIAAGGKAYYDKDNVSHIFKSLQDNNIRIKNTYPALAPLHIDKNIFDNSSKFRFEAKISLIIDDQIVSDEYGEIQINNDIISGIPILNLSSKAIKALNENKRVDIKINFIYSFLYDKYKNDRIYISFDEYIFDEMYKYFDYQKLINSNLNIKQILSYILDTQIIDIILNSYKIKNDKILNISQDSIKKIIESLISFKLNIISYADYKNAQLMQGGVDINEINDKTFESNKIKNLYFIGEIIDIDGLCGGYNLQFAFGSGWTVGKVLNDKN